MLTLQSHQGHITANGVRHVRQAVLTGEQVHRADVLAIITELLDLRRLETERHAGAQIIALPSRRTS